MSLIRHTDPTINGHDDPPEIETSTSEDDKPPKKRISSPTAKRETTVVVVTASEASSVLRGPIDKTDDVVDQKVNLASQTPIPRSSSPEDQHPTITIPQGAVFSTSECFNAKNMYIIPNM